MSEDLDDVILQDNILLKTEQEKISSEKEKLISFPVNNPEPIFSFGRDGSIVFFNESKSHNLPNITNFTDIFPDKKQKDIDDFIDKALEDSITVYENEKYYLLNLKGSADSNRILVYGVDTTELNILNKDLEKKVKEELDKNREKDFLLIQQSRHAQMGEMITMIAHQWRQPLSSISSNVIALQVQQELEGYNKEFYDEQLEKISGLTQYLSKTIDDFRKFFKEEKEKTSTSLEDIVADSLYIIESILVSKGIELEIEYLCNEKILSYPKELKQVVLNLLKNTQEAIEEKKISNPKINIKTYKDKKNFYLEIKDNAGGIEEDIKEKIFDPYFTTKDTLNGTGLGLYMSKKIIQEYCNGDIKVRNTDGGVSFTIEI